MAENRLIDANALIKHKRKMNGADFGGEFWDEAVLVSDINNAPTVDAVKVVRCGLCEHWDVNRLYCHHPAGLSFCGKTGAAKGFCCFGERRTDG